MTRTRDVAHVARHHAWMARGVAFVFLWLACAFAHAWEAGSDGLMPIPPLRDRVTDLTQTLPPTATQALVAKLAAWEQKSGNQLVVLLVPTTQPESIEAYGIRVADAWKIGRKGHDNGALLIVAKNDRKLRIEVGYGLEGTLTDAASRRIIGEVIAPFFRQNQFDKGVDAGVDAIIATVDKDPTSAVAPPPSSRSGGATRASDIPIEMLLILAFVIVPVVGGGLRRIFGSVRGTMLSSGLAGVGTWLILGSVLLGIAAAIVALVVLLFTSGGGSGFTRRGGGVWVPPSGGGGGGWGGGGGGGFSGGGGGFGGGGASGSW